MQPKRAYKRRSDKELAPVRQEIAQLFDQARAFFEQGDKRMAQRRVKQARRKAMKVQLPLPEYALLYCRSCENYLRQGVNCTIRIRNGIRILRCQECGAVRRKVMRGTGRA